MRTIRQTAQYLRENDPLTALTETAIRRLLITGALPHVRIGAKYLIDLDSLEAFLRGA
jgi:excisionase family DNA binding protein